MRNLKHFAPRILWAYDHPTGRYQEINLLMEAGFEVVMSLGKASKGSEYLHNEMHHLYPQWRSSCTLASHLVEQIRAVDLQQTDYSKPAQETIDLINAHIDAIILNDNIQKITEIMRWFKGVFIYRINGFYDMKTQENVWFELNAMLTKNPAWQGRFFYCPALKGLVPEQYPLVVSHQFMINVWVAPERMFSHWAMADSAPAVVTAISYMDQQPYFKQQYTRLQAAMKALPLIVIGKNRKRKNIAGMLSDEDFYGTIANARIFVEAGDCPEHLIFPPLEAIAMGVPILFHVNNALAQEARDYGYTDAQLKEVGMFDSFQEINVFIEQRHQDIECLTELAAKQRQFFLTNLFGYAKALEGARLLHDVLADKILQQNPLIERQRSVFHQQAMQAHKNGMTHFKPLQSSVFSQSSLFMMPNLLKGDVGEIIFDAANASFIKILEVGHSRPGNMIYEVLPNKVLKQQWAVISFLSTSSEKQNNKNIAYQFSFSNIKAKMMTLVRIMLQIIVNTPCRYWRLAIKKGQSLRIKCRRLLKMCYYRYPWFRKFALYFYALYSDQSKGVATARLIILKGEAEKVVYEQTISATELAQGEMRVPLSVLNQYQDHEKRLALHWSGRETLVLRGIKFEK
jgi:hypothetical protein